VKVGPDVSYRIAHVRFTPDGHAYPVNCHRADIGPGSQVVVHLPNREPKLKRAEVVEVAYLNWDCTNTIIGLVSEVAIEKDGSFTVTRGPRNPRDVDTPKELVDQLIERAWRYYYSANKVWRAVYTKTVGDQAFFILSRVNGIDFMTCPAGKAPKPEGRKLRMALSEGRCARHGYYGSGVDLYRFTLDFAEAVEAGQTDLKDFFVSRGGPQPKPQHASARSDLADIRDAISSGYGGPVYLSDDVYL
jgi:hypothetical protein